MQKMRTDNKTVDIRLRAHFNNSSLNLCHMEKLQPNKWVDEAEEKNAHTAAAASEETMTIQVNL